jgi:hypothetical protein
VEAWELLVQDLWQVQLSTDVDQVKWAIGLGGKFSVSSLYRKINQDPNLPQEKLL